MKQDTTWRATLVKSVGEPIITRVSRPGGKALSWNAVPREVQEYLEARRTPNTVRCGITQEEWDSLKPDESLLRVTRRGPRTKIVTFKVTPYSKCARGHETQFTSLGCSECFWDETFKAERAAVALERIAKALERPEVWPR